MSLTGSRELRARLRAIGVSFKPIGRSWADDAAALMRSHTKVRTGATRRSIRRRNATQRRATVVGSFKVRFLNSGTKAHTETARGRAMKFQGQGRTIFSKKVNHPRVSGSHYVRRDAMDAFAKHPMAETLIREWNEASR